MYKRLELIMEAKDGIMSKILQQQNSIKDFDDFCKTVVFFINALHPDIVSVDRNFILPWWREYSTIKTKED